MRAWMQKQSRTYKTMVTTCSGSTVSPLRAAARAVSAMSVANVQRQKNAAHATNTKKNF